VLSASKCAALGAGRTGYTGCVSVPVTSSCAGSAATAAAALGLMLERGQHGTLLLGAGPLVHRLAEFLLALRCDGAEVLFLDNMAADAVSYHCWLKGLDITARDVGWATHAHTHTHTSKLLKNAVRKSARGKDVSSLKEERGDTRMCGEEGKGEPIHSPFCMR
jgi:hypothetical protein